MRKHLISALLITSLLVGSTSQVFAQDVPADQQPAADQPVTNAQGQTYEQWKAEYDRIQEENKKIEEKNKQIDEQNRKNEEEYKKQMEEYNKRFDTSGERTRAAKALIERMKNEAKNAPAVTQAPRRPVATRTPTPTPTPTPNPVQTVMISSVNDKGDETSQKTEKETIEQINKAFEEKKISIKKDRPDLIILTSNDVAVEIPFPVIVNTDTKRIQVITPSGTKTISTLSDKAVETAKEKSGLSEVTGTVRLEEFNKQPVYVITGKKTFKVLHFFTVKRSFEIRISAETGEVTDASKSIVTSLAQRLSF